MSLLATMMLRAGLLSEGQVAAVQDHASARQLPLVDAMLELGLTDEDALVTFFHGKLSIPRVGPSILARLDPQVVERIPAEVAWQHTVIPVTADDLGNLTLAMLDPTDLRAVDAVATHTGAYLVRAVAPRSALREAIDRYYGDVAAGQRPTLQPGAEGSRPFAATAASMGAATLPSPPIAREARPRHVRNADDDGWSPTLITADIDPEPLSAEAFGRVIPRLVEADDRDEIMRILVDFLGAGFHRVLLFAHVSGELRGHDGRGADLLLDAVRQVRIPATGRSVFADVIQRRSPYFGPLRPDSTINRAFSEALGGVRGNVLVLPVVLRERVPVVVFASGTTYPVDPRSIGVLADGVSSALERLILRRKSGV